jgi:metal-dependent HD superfamily phosphatase/phosphodiesterase
VEIVEISALLHDYASVKDFTLYENHHLHGAKLAEKILKELNYPQDKIEQIKHCILCHRGRKITQKLTKEALCVADGDSMAHFDSISSLFYLAFFSKKMNIEEANNWLLEKLERSWNKLSPEGKEIIQEKYNASKILLKK